MPQNEYATTVSFQFTVYKNHRTSAFQPVKWPKTLTEGEADSAGQPVVRELGDSEEDVAQEEAGHMACLALPVQHVMRTGAQTAGSEGGGQEERRQEQPYGVQSEPQVPISFFPLYLRWKFLGTREDARFIRGVFQQVFDAELP